MSTVCPMYVYCISTYVQSVKCYFLNQLTNIEHIIVWLGRRVWICKEFILLQNLRASQEMWSDCGSGGLKPSKPTRTTNRYRNYSDEDVVLLRFVKQQRNTGALIGGLSRLGREELLISTPGIGGAALARWSSRSGHQALPHGAHSIKNSLGHESRHLRIYQRWITG